MKIPIEIRRSLLWILVQLFVFFVSPSVSETEVDFKAAIFCDRNDNVTDEFKAYVGHVMDELSTRIDRARWAAYMAPSPNPMVYGLAQCYGGLSPKACSYCFQQARMRLENCISSNSVRVFLDGCFLRFDRYNFLGESLDEGFDEVECGPEIVTDAGDEFMAEEFARKGVEVISNVTKSALANSGFSVLGERGGMEGVYALAQCWNTIDGEGCKKCFAGAISKLKDCLPAKGGRAFYTGCYLRYSTEKFYTSLSEIDGEDQLKLGFIIVGFLSIASLLLIAFFGARLGYMKLSMRRQEKNAIKGNMHNFHVNFKYEVLEKATDSFNASRKLGQGGSGSVYMGILPNGHIVAVKRLFFNSRQWVDEFFNEVNLIGGMKHKNLVKLLGCSIEGPESLLVYEYVPYRSLDQVLFAKNGRQILSWNQRFDIIFGIAEGLAYLHEGCDVKIIHRDIKTGNILLDGNYIPKIADFGLARCISSSKSHINTGIAGTLGYMAPEYLVRGQLTEKVDVYAFGVLILEIACGKKISLFTRGSNSLLHSVWKHYKINQITESVDSALESNFPAKEAANVLQIGLLCTQALVTLRPSMSEVVQMLKNEDSEIPMPRQPPFLNSTVLTEDTSRSITLSSVDLDEKDCSGETNYYTVDMTSFSKTQLDERMLDSETTDACEL